ncbi:MAG: sugar phosphate isomerase/epimerase [Thaumarchaeota archaeon]|nr:sugar phosphate isomerase/epimerase [Nitrososphaerota archaeon]
MKLAIDTSMIRGLPLESALGSLRGLGYSNVEVGMAHYYPHIASDAETKRFEETLSSSGVELAALCGTYPIAYPEDEVRRKGVQYFQSTIERARQLGCKLVVSEMMGESKRFSDCAGAFKRSVGELEPTLERAGVTICFEAHPGDLTDKNQVAVDLIKGLESSHVRYLFCVPHCFILGEDMAQMVDYAKDTLGYVHLADTLRPKRTFFSGRYSPDVPPHQHLTLGKGDVDLAAVISSLKKANYEGFVSVNPFSMFDRPMESAAESRRVISALLDLDD